MDERERKNKYFLKKRIFALMFLVAIFSFSVINFVKSYQPIEEAITEKIENKLYNPSKIVSLIETTINENLLRKIEFIEIFGFIQTFLNKKEYNNFTYIKDEAGFLHYSSFYQEDDPQIFEYAIRVKRLQDFVEQNGAKVLFVVPPSKYNSNISFFETGMRANDPNPVVDEMLFNLNLLGVETLDMRKCLPNEQISYEKTFFKTDHHWTIPAAFYATYAIKDKIEESFGKNLDPDDYYLDINNYEQVTYYSGMLGSMGRKTGANFCGVENFTALWPKFRGAFSRESIFLNGQSNLLIGCFTETLMVTSVLTDKIDLYKESPYSLYLNGICYYEKILNLENPNGCKIFMIRDSYFSPVIAFLAPMCGEIDAIWSLEDIDQLAVETYVKENKFDYVVIEVYPYNINNEAFNYFKEP